MARRKIFLFSFYGVLGICLCSCDKLLDVGLPKNQLTTEDVFNDSTSIIAATLNIYSLLERQHYAEFNRRLSNYTYETSSISANEQGWNQSALTADDSWIRTNWTYLYNAIYQCNALIEELSRSEGITEDFRMGIIAEAMFLRAYCYFFLVNTFEHVPLITGTDVNENRLKGQVESQVIYQFIVSELNTVRNDMARFLPTENTRANIHSVNALLAKVYLFRSEWSLAEQLSTAVIEDGSFGTLESMGNVFTPASGETILQFATQNGYLIESQTIVPSSAEVIPNYYFNTAFIESFELGDGRVREWMGSNTVMANGTVSRYVYPYKYKNRAASNADPENVIVLRASELYLIRAEARANSGNLIGTPGAVSDVNLIRRRAGLPSIHPDTREGVLEAIYTERAHELFFENGNLFMDLKRSGRLQAVMSRAKATWRPYAALLPLPLHDILTNQNLIQNDGYN